MKNFMDIIIEQPFHIIIGEYLDISDNKNLMKLNKEIYNNKISNNYFKRIITAKAKKILMIFMKKYVNYIKYNNNIHNNIHNDMYDLRINKISTLITKKMNALYYFRNYEKQYINMWYNMNIPFKKALLDKYKNNNNVDNPTRYDLYYLIKKMDIDDVYLIGW
jgi:hypothetical protein